MQHNSCIVTTEPSKFIISDNFAPAVMGRCYSLQFDTLIIHWKLQETPIILHISWKEHCSHNWIKRKKQTNKTTKKTPPQQTNIFENFLVRKTPTQQYIHIGCIWTHITLMSSTPKMMVIVDMFTNKHDGEI